MLTCINRQLGGGMRINRIHRSTVVYPRTAQDVSCHHRQCWQRRAENAYRKVSVEKNPMKGKDVPEKTP